MLLLNLNTSSSTPLYKQVIDQIKQLIDSELLKPGDKLPSTRVLAKRHNLNRNTICKAYEELWALGYIESSSGSYSKVRKRIINVFTEPNNKNNTYNWENIISKNSNILRKSVQKEIVKINPVNKIDFRPLSPDPKILPSIEFRKCLNEILRSGKSEILLYGEAEGFYPLRTFLARHMQLHAINTNINDIIITNGAQNALDMIVKLLINPGDTIIIEKPTYSEAIPIFKYYNANIIELPVYDEGMNLNELEQVLQKHNPKFLYTMPNFQNPTGTTTSQAHREKLLSICEKYNLPIIEDGFVEEMKYFGKNILPIKSMDKKGLVFYIGTFSKVLFPGIRIGWIASNEYCTKRFSEIRKVTEISMNTINQAALELFCRNGSYEKQLKKNHTIYKKRMGVALKTLRENLHSNDFKYTKPIGGYTIWFGSKKSKITENQLIKLIQQEGVLVTRGSQSFYSNTNSTCFRISIAHRNEEEIKTGINIITQVLNSLNN